MGVYGFLHGGLIVEDGKRDGDVLSPLLHRCAIPEGWRVALLRPEVASGLHGAKEQQAFAALPAVAEATSQQLRREVSQQMLPALADADFEAFSRSVTTYGEIAGGCFADTQGGPYNGPVLQELVQVVRKLGVPGVGQSSWGPTIYCFLPSESAAARFAKQAGDKLPGANLQITRPCNHGATIKSNQSANPHPPGMSCTLSRNP